MKSGLKWLDWQFWATPHIFDIRFYRNRYSFYPHMGSSTEDWGDKEGDGEIEKMDGKWFLPFLDADPYKESRN